MDIEGKITSHGEIIVKQKRNKNIVNVFKSYAVDEDLTHRFAVPCRGAHWPPALRAPIGEGKVSRKFQSKSLYILLSKDLLYDFL